MVNFPPVHQRLHKALACVLNHQHFYGRFVSLQTSEAILNELAPIDKHLTKANLENGVLNKMDANFMLAVALKDQLSVPSETAMAVRGVRCCSGSEGECFYADGVFPSIQSIPGESTIKSCPKEGILSGSLREILSYLLIFPSCVNNNTENTVEITSQQCNKRSPCITQTEPPREHRNLSALVRHLTIKREAAQKQQRLCQLIGKSSDSSKS